jgi:hypothetical protein
MNLSPRGHNKAIAGAVIKGHHCSKYEKTYDMFIFFCTSENFLVFGVLKYVFINCCDEHTISLFE